jgi:hypothetical protein
MAKAREEPEVKEWIKVIQERYKGKHLIVARDKLDNVRGVRQKLLAYELFLNKYPQWRQNVSRTCVKFCCLANSISTGCPLASRHIHYGEQRALSHCFRYQHAY